MHYGRTRYMKCPKCNKRSWNKKVISKDQIKVEKNASLCYTYIVVSQFDHSRDTTEETDNQKQFE